MRKRVVFTGLIVAVLALFFILQIGNTDHEPESLLVFTRVPVSTNPMLNGPQHIPQDFKEAQIVSLNYNEREEGTRLLTGNFYSAVSPSLSFNNQRIAFSAKENESDSWQIWTMNLDGSDKKRLIQSNENCYTPAFLPTGSLVFSCEKRDPDVGLTYPLFKIKPDGSDLEQITFHPHQNFNPSMLYDGRIAMVSQQVYPQRKRPVLMVLRPDGTKAQSFYHEKSEFYIKSAVRENSHDKLIFIQSDGEVDQLVSLSYANPTLSKEIIHTYDAGNILSIDILDSTQVVVSSKMDSTRVFVLSSVSFAGDENLIYFEENYHSIQPVALRNRRVPRKLPTSISKEKGSGILISQDVNHSQIEVPGDSQTRYIRVEGIDETLEEFEVSEDGSFYLKVQSNMPIRFISLDEEMERLRGPSDWMWLRTNERRACVGCHANKVFAPENRVPLAIHEDPISITDTSRVASMTEVQAVRQIIDKN